MAKYSNEVVYNIKTNFDASGIKQLQNELNKLSQQITKGGPAKIFDSDEIVAAQEKIEALKTSLNKAYNTKTGMLNLSMLNSELKKNDISAKSLSTTMERFGLNANSAIRKTLLSLTTLNQEAIKTNSTLSKIATTFGNTVRWGITAGIFQEMMSSISGAVGYMKELDESLTQIQMVSRQSAQNMRDLAQYANKAAQSLATTTVDYTNAIKVFTQEGFNLADSKLQAELSVKLANVSEQDTATTADQITAYRNAFGLSIEEMSASLDKLANVANNTATNVGELMTAAQRSASVAAAVGASEDTFIASVSTIQSVTRQSAEEIGNGLKTIMQRFADIRTGKTAEDGVDYGEYATALKKVGVDVLDASGQFKGFDQILSELQEVWGGLSDTMKVAVGEKVAGKFQYNRFAALMNNQEYFDKAYASTQNADGMMDAMQDTYAQSIEGRMKTLQAAGEQVVSTLFNQDAIEPVLENVTTMLNLLNDLIDTAGGLQPVLLAISAAMLKAFSPQIGQQISNMASNFMLSSQMSAAKNGDMTKILGTFGATNENTKAASAAYTGSTLLKGASSESIAAWQQGMKQIVQEEEELNALTKQQTENAQKVVDKYEAIIETVNEIILSSRENNRELTQEERTLVNIASELDSVLMRNTKVDATGKRVAEDVSLIESELVEAAGLIDGITTSSARVNEQFKAASGSAERLGQATNAVQEKTLALNTSVAGMNKTLSEMATTAIAGGMSKAFSGLTSGLFAVTAAMSAWKTISDETASSSERIEAGLMGIAMVVPMFGATLTGLSSAYETIIAANGAMRAEYLLTSDAIKALNLSSEEQLAIRQACNAKDAETAIFQQLIAKGIEEEAAAETARNAVMQKSSITRAAEIALEKLGIITTEEGTAAKGRGLLATLKLAAANALAAIGTGLLTVSTFAATVAMKGFSAACAANPILGLITIILGAVAVIGGLIFAIKNASDEYNKFSNAVDSAREQLQQAEDNLEETQQALNELNNILNELQSDQDAFNGLTKGTEEWDKAIKNANDDALAFLDTYRDILTSGEFSGEILTKGSHGETVVTQEAQDFVQNKLEQQNSSARYQQSAASQELASAKRKNNAVNLVREKGLDDGAGFAAGATTIAGSAAKGAVLGLAAGATGAGVGAIPGAIIGAIGGTVIGIMRAGEAAANAEEKYAEDMEAAGRAISDGKINLESFESFKESLQSVDSRFNSYSDEMLQNMFEASSELKGLGDAYNTAAEAQRAAARVNAQQSMANNKNYQNLSGEEQQVVTDAIASQTIEGGAIYEKAKSEVEGYSDEELKQAFADLNDGIEYVNGKFYEIDAETGKRTEVEDGYDESYMQNAVTADKVSQQAESFGTELAKTIKNSNFNDDQLAALKAYASDPTQFGTDENGKPLYSTIEEFISALQNGSIAVKRFTDATDKIALASSFNELSGAKSAADAEDKNTPEKTATEESYEKQVSSIAQSEAQRYDLDFEEITVQAEALEKQYGLTKAAANALAIENQRMNKGVESLSKNWKNWNDILKNSNKTDLDYIKATKELNKAISDLVGASEDLKLSDEFYDSAENMELLAQAAEGSEEAINRLGIAVAKDTVKMMEFSRSMSGLDFSDADAEQAFMDMSNAFNNVKNTVLSGLNDLQNNLDSIGFGDNVYDQLGGADWVNAVNKMAMTTGMSVEQMNSMLNSMGVQAELTTTTKKTKVGVPWYKTEETVTEKGEGSTKTYSKESRVVKQGIDYVDGEIEVAQINTGDAVGGAPTITYTGNGSVGSSSKGGGGKSSGGSGGGGGGGKAKKKRTEEADKNKRDPFIEIQNVIDRQTSELKKQEELGDELYGTGKIKNLEKIIKFHQKLADLYREEAKIQKQQLEMQRTKSTDEYGNKTVKGYAEAVEMTVQYNEDGDIVNGKAIQDAIYAKYEAAYNTETAHSDEDDYSEYTEETKKWKELLDGWKEAEQSYGDALDNLDDINASIRSEIDAIQDGNDSIVDTLQEMLGEWRDLAKSLREFDKGASEFMNGADYLSNFNYDAAQGAVDFNEILKWNGVAKNKNGEEIRVSWDNKAYEKFASDIESANKNAVIKATVNSADIKSTYNDVEGKLRNAIVNGNSNSAYNDAYNKIMSDSNLNTQQRQAELNKLNDYVSEVTQLAKTSLENSKQKVFAGLEYTSITGSSMWQSMLQSISDRTKEAYDAFGYTKEGGFDKTTGRDTNEDGTFTDLTQQASYENLKNALDGAKDTLSDLESIINSEEEVISNGLDKIADLVDAQLQKYDNILDRLDSINSINELMYGENSQALDNRVSIDDASIEALSGKMKTIDLGLTQNETIVNQYKDILAEYNKNADARDRMTWEQFKQSNLISEKTAESIQKAEDKITELQQQQMETEAEWLEKIADRLEAEATKAARNFANNLLGGDVDWMQQEWEMQSRNEELYLDDMNRAYQIQKLQYSYQQMLNDSANSNSLIQQKIAAHMEDQLSYLQDKNNLSQTDVDYANARLEILQKQIALEDAQSNKTQMRLARDASGNYSYVYTANEDDVAQKQQELLDAQINAYNIAKEGLLEAEKDTIDQISSARDQIISIWTDANLDADEREARIKEVMDSLGEYTEGRTEQIKTYSLDMLQSVAETEGKIADENEGSLTNIYDTMEENLTAAVESIDERFATFSTNTGINIASVNADVQDLGNSMTAVAEAVSKSHINTLENFQLKASDMTRILSTSLNKYTTDTETALLKIGVSIGEDENSGLTGLINRCKDAATELTEVDFSVMEKSLQKITTAIGNAVDALYGTDGSSGMRNTLVEVEQTFKELYDSSIQWLESINSAVGTVTTSIGGLGTAIADTQTKTQVVKNDPEPPSSSSQSSGPQWDHIEAIYDAMNYGWTGNGASARINWAESHGYTEQEYWIAQDFLNKIYAGWSWGSAKSAVGFKTGGYTGNWYNNTGIDDDNGKLAILHQKELILNANDTENLLDIIKQVRQMQNLDLSQTFDLSKIGSQSSHDTIEQRVEITAEFPSVTSSQEIESALLNLADMAYQSAHKNY